MGGRSSAFRRAVTAFLSACIMLAASGMLSAEETGDFSFKLLPDGTPRFTQVLRWEHDPNVSFYRVYVQTASGENITEERTEQPELQLNLEPGEYRFRVILFNLLEKPELELPWNTFTVKRAEIPRIGNWFPGAWYLDELDPVLSLSGTDLMPGAKVVLSHTTRESVYLNGEVVEQEGTTRVNIRFPSMLVQTGTYSFTLTNPGGLTAVIPRALDVSFQRPVDLHVSAGFAPWLPLYDSWSVQTWPGTVFPLSAVARFSVHFLKTGIGYFGGELTTGGRFMSGGIEGADIRSVSGSVGLNAVYRLLFSKTLSVSARAGGGIVLSNHVFEYAGRKGATLSSIDPCISAGVSLTRHLTKKIFLEAGADWMQMFASEFTAGGIMPFICAGYSF